MIRKRNRRRELHYSVFDGLLQFAAPKPARVLQFLISKGYPLIFGISRKSQHQRAGKRPRLRRMIPDVFDPKPDFLENLARNGPFGALARLYEARQNGVHTLRPYRLPSQQALFSRPYQNDYRRVRAREMHNSALRVNAGAAVPAFPDFVSASAGAAKLIALMPVHQGFGISEKRSVLSAKATAQRHAGPETAPHGQKRLALFHLSQQQNKSGRSPRQGKN